MHNWSLEKTRNLVRSLAGIAEYLKTHPDYRDEDDYGRPTREAMLADYLYSALDKATALLASEAEVDWQATDRDLIMTRGEAGCRRVLARYGLNDPWEHHSHTSLIQAPEPLVGSLDELHANWRFDTFDVNHPLHDVVAWQGLAFDAHAQRASLQHALEQAQQFAAQPQGWLLLSGPHSVGKSHLAGAIIQAVIDRGVFPRYLSAPSYAHRYLAADDPLWDTDQALLTHADLVVVDNLHIGYKLAWSAQLETFLRGRHRHQRPTVLVSTRSREDLPLWMVDVVTEVALVPADHDIFSRGTGFNDESR